MKKNVLNNVTILLRLLEIFEKRNNVSPTVVNLRLLDWHRCDFINSEKSNVNLRLYELLKTCWRVASFDLPLKLLWYLLMAFILFFEVLQTITFSQTFCDSRRSRMSLLSFSGWLNQYQKLLGTEW